MPIEQYENILLGIVDLLENGDVIEGRLRFALYMKLLQNNWITRETVKKFCDCLTEYRQLSKSEMMNNELHHSSIRRIRRHD